MNTLTYTGIPTPTSLVGEAIETIAARIAAKAEKRKPAYGITHRIVHFQMIEDGFQILFEGGRKLRFLVKECTARFKDSLQRAIIRKSKEDGRFDRVIFVYAKQRVESVIHKVVDCIKSFFNADRRKHDKRVHVTYLKHAQTERTFTVSGARR